MQVFDRRLVRLRRDRAAHRLHEHDFLFREVAERLGERLEGIRRSFRTVLALGSRGVDDLHPQLESRGVETFVSSDLSAQLVRQAPGLGVAADGEFLPFASGSFDLVLSCLDLHWVNDLPGLLLQARAALKPDGLFLAAMLGGETLGELHRALLEADLETTGGGSPRISPFADLRDAAGLLQRAGFALPVADSDTITVTYPDAFALMRDLRGMAEANAVAKRSRCFTRRDTLAAAAARYAALFGDGEGRVRATFQVLFLTGWAPAASQQQPLRPGAARNRLADALGTTEHATGDKALPRP